MSSPICRVDEVNDKGELYFLVSFGRSVIAEVHAVPGIGFEKHALEVAELIATAPVMIEQFKDLLAAYELACQNPDFAPEVAKRIKDAHQLIAKAEIQ